MLFLMQVGALTLMCGYSQMPQIFTPRKKKTFLILKKNIQNQNSREREQEVTVPELRKQLDFNFDKYWNQLKMTGKVQEERSKGFTLRQFYLGKILHQRDFLKCSYGLIVSLGGGFCTRRAFCVIFGQEDFSFC